MVLHFIKPIPAGNNDSVNLVKKITLNTKLKNIRLQLSSALYSHLMACSASRILSGTNFLFPYWIVNDRNSKRIYTLGVQINSSCIKHWISPKFQAWVASWVEMSTSLEFSSIVAIASFQSVEIRYLSIGQTASTLPFLSLSLVIPDNHRVVRIEKHHLSDWSNYLPPTKPQIIGFEPCKFQLFTSYPLFSVSQNLKT